MRRAFAVSSLAALLGMVVGMASVAADTPTPRSDLKNFQHVFVIMMENTGYDTLVGNPNAPWINSALATYGSATNYFGVIHPSQPNYVSMTAGFFGNDSDDDETLNVTNLADQIEASGRTWKSYNQSFSLCNGNALAHACGNQLYERKHNPFVSFADIQSSPSRLANIVDLSQLDTDLASGHVPDYVYIDPDQCHDMHGRAATPADPCDFSQVPSLIATGDQFLSDTVGKITSSSAWNGNSVIFIQWDEADFTGSATDFGFGDTSGCCDSIPNHGGGHVVSIVISHSNHAPATSSTAYNHYSLLRTIQEGWHLGCLANTCDTANVPSMSALTGPRG